MSRRFILKGDNTDSNGVVLDGIAGSSFDGRPLAYVGAPVFCNTCSAEGVIIGDGSPRSICVPSCSPDETPCDPVNPALT
jgi:uncharacterized Zn-binding protein involved in type VI secretion